MCGTFYYSPNRHGRTSEAHAPIRADLQTPTPQQRVRALRSTSLRRWNHEGVGSNLGLPQQSGAQPGRPPCEFLRPGTFQGGVYAVSFLMRASRMIFLNSSITKTVEATRTTTNQSWDSRVVVFSKSPTTTSPKGRPMLAP